MLDEPGLFHIQRTRFFNRVVDRVHHLAGSLVTYESYSVSYDDFISPACQFEFASRRLGEVRNLFAVAVTSIENRALRVIKRKPRSCENVLAHRARQLQVEMDVVQRQQLPELAFMDAQQMKKIRNGVGFAGVAMAIRIDRSVFIAISATPQIASALAGECG